MPIPRGLGSTGVHFGSAIQQSVQGRHLDPVLAQYGRWTNMSPDGDQGNYAFESNDSTMDDQGFIHGPDGQRYVQVGDDDPTNPYSFHDSNNILSDPNNPLVQRYGALTPASNLIQHEEGWTDRLMHYAPAAMMAAVAGPAAFADLTGGGGALSAEATNPNYWNMMANSGGILSDAAPEVLTGGTTGSALAPVAGTSMAGTLGILAEEGTGLAPLASAPSAAGDVPGMLSTAGSSAGGSALNGLIPDGFPLGDIISGAAQIFGGHQQQQNASSDASSNRDFIREMYGTALHASRPNQTDVHGNTRTWTDDGHGNWTQADHYSADNQHREDLFNQIAGDRMTRASNVNLDPSPELRAHFGIPNIPLSAGAGALRPAVNSAPSGSNGMSRTFGGGLLGLGR